MSKTRDNKPLNWVQPVHPNAVSADTRQLRRAKARDQAIRRMRLQFPGEGRDVYRILALDSLRTHKKGV
jgi:hypothetical protein